jgi:hypothetical protein
MALYSALGGFNDSAPKHRRIHVSDEGVALVSAKSGRDLWRVAWDQLEQIVAFKVDAITMDHICLGFRQAGDSTLHVTDEDTPGWNLLCDQLSGRFGVAREAWFAEVASPAFAQNLTVLWSAG